MKEKIEKSCKSCSRLVNLICIVVQLYDEVLIEVLMDILYHILVFQIKLKFS